MTPAAALTTIWATQCIRERARGEPHGLPQSSPEASAAWASLCLMWQEA